MKIILIQDIEKLGKRGDIKEVATGFARNFLFPQNLAKPATESSVKTLKQEQLNKEKGKIDEVNRFQELAKKLEGTEISFSIALGETGRAFGSISTKDIMDELKKKKVEINKEWIELEEPLKKTGGWDIKIKLPHGIETIIKVVVEAKKEIKKQVRKRTAVK